MYKMPVYIGHGAQPFISCMTVTYIYNMVLLAGVYIYVQSYNDHAI